MREQEGHQARILDDSPDEIRLSWPIIQRFAGRFHFNGSLGPHELAPVDVQATNEQVALCGRRLDDFVTVPPLDSRVIPLKHCAAANSTIEPRAVALVMLCGGLSFRSQGEIHPLKFLLDPQTGDNRTLLDRQLDRLGESPLNESPCVIMATPLNEAALHQHIAELSPKTDLRVCIAGLAPRLLPNQRTTGSPLVVRGPSGDISYNPVGHLEALRWLILSGMLSEFTHYKAIVIFSYSNWGRIFTPALVDIAGSLVRAAREDEHLLFFVEVTERDLDKESGSILVADNTGPDRLRLVKFSYGRGRPRLALGNRVPE